MQLIINLPNREETLSLVRERWDEVLRDPRWVGVEGRFETNSFGEVIVNPPPTFFHNDRAYRIAASLGNLLGGQGRTEVPVLTIDGVKSPDAVWFSQARYESSRGLVALDLAPEICVEVVSPKNTQAEMRHKRNLYFNAGAEECWVCDLEGRMTYYTKDNPDEAKPTSSLCPDFPPQVDA